MIDIIPSKNGIYVRDGDHTYCIRPPVFSLFNYRQLRQRRVILGFVGASGSGKSVGATRTIILDYMLRGKKVWSNMDIGFNLIHNGQSTTLRSQPLEKLSLVELDEVYRNGLLYVDEVNMLAEARRAMSRENVAFSYILQQLRKRRLNLIWSAQSEMHCEERVRWQTDVFIMCKDVSVSNPKCGIGELSHWAAYDMTGLIRGNSPASAKDAVFYEGVIWNKPWWNAYNTWQLQGAEGETAEKPIDAVQSEAIRIAGEIAKYMKTETPRARVKDLWGRWGVTSHALRIRIGQLLSQEHGISKEYDMPQSKWYVVEEAVGASA